MMLERIDQMLGACMTCTAMLPKLVLIGMMRICQAALTPKCLRKVMEVMLLVVGIMNAALPLIEAILTLDRDMAGALDLDLQ